MLDKRWWELRQDDGYDGSHAILSITMNQQRKRKKIEMCEMHGLRLNIKIRKIYLKKFYFSIIFCWNSYYSRSVAHYVIYTD